MARSGPPLHVIWIRLDAQGDALLTPPTHSAAPGRMENITPDEVVDTVLYALNRTTWDTREGVVVGPSDAPAPR